MPLNALILLQERLPKHQPRRDTEIIIEDSSFFTMQQEKLHDSRTETASESSNSYFMLS